MRARGGLRWRPRNPPPSPAAREAIACIRRYLEHGCTAQELAAAQAALAEPPQPRQRSLPLAPRR